MDKENRHPNIRALKLWYTLCPLYFYFMVANAVFANLAPYYNIYLSAEIVNEITENRNVKKLVILVLITVLGNLVITVVGGILKREFDHRSIFLDQRETALFYNKTLTLDYEDLEKADVRQLRRKITESSRIDNHGKQSLLFSINNLAHCLVNIMLAAYLFTEMIVKIISTEFSWTALFFIVVFIILIILNVWINFFVKDHMAKISNHVSQIMIDENRIDDAVECYNMGKDVRLYRQDKLIMKIKNYGFDLHKTAFKKMHTTRFRLDVPTQFLSHSLQASIYIFVCIYASKGVFGVGSIIKYIGFIQRLIYAIINLFHISADIRYNTSFIRDYLAYFDIPMNLQQGTIPIEKSTFKNKYEIEFRNVSFQYPASDSYALHNVSFKINTGKKLAVVGMNGSGKTTFIKLLCRLYDPTEGEILLNGRKIQEYKYEDYLSMFSVVFQDFKLFSFSLSQNVAAMKNSDKQTVEDCLKKAGFEERLTQMPEGIDTYLYKDFDENGVEVSGGEAQKIALARALYKDSSFVILDEPTSALDPIAEYEVYSKFNEIVKNKTAIYISHRLSSCKFCDDIVVFHKGEIVQYGDHDKLILDKKGKYYELWNAQSQYYVEN